MNTNETIIQQLQAAPTEPAEKVSSLGRKGRWILFGGLLVLLAWAALAPLDEGVPTMGTVSIDTKRKTVQHPQGGVITEVLVREGQLVKEDEVLIKLGADSARANFEASRQRYLGLRAIESRLLAEQRGQSTITFHPDVMAEQADPLIQRHILTQQQLHATRQSAQAAEVQSAEESIRGLEATIQALTGMIESRRSQREIVSEQLGGIRSLVKEQYAPRNQQLELERQLADISTSLADLQGNLTRNRQSIAELRQRIVFRKQEYRREVETQLADVTREVQSEEGRFTAFKGDLARTEIRSPADGQVVGMQFQTVGGVIPPAQRIMDVVPQDEQLLIDAQIPPHLIDAVKPGQKVDVRFNAFAHSPQLVVEGEVQSVSGDLLAEQGPMGPISYFLTRVRITPEGRKGLGKHQIHPGMPAEVVIVTGERTVLTYLLHPLTRRVAASMKEQ